MCVSAFLGATRPGSLAVLLGQGQGQVLEELVHRQLNLRGEVCREHRADDDDEAVSQDLQNKGMTCQFRLLTLEIA